MRRIVLVAMLWTAELAIAHPVDAGQPPIPIRDAIADANGDNVPDRVGETLTIVAVVTFEPRVLGQNITVSVVQDDTAAMIVLADRPNILVGKFERGDSVRVTGPLSVYHGRVQLTIKTIDNLGKGVLPAPRHVTWPNSPGRITAMLAKSPETQDGPRASDASSASSSKTARGAPSITDYFLQDTSHIAEAGRVTIVGNRTVSGGQPGDYRLTPRDPATSGSPLIRIRGRTVADALWRSARCGRNGAPPTAAM
jgi:hypothetical protein